MRANLEIEKTQNPACGFQRYYAGGILTCLLVNMYHIALNFCDKRKALSDECICEMT